MVDDVNVLYRFGQFQYNIGNYGASADLLYHFRILVYSRDLIDIVHGRRNEHGRDMG